MQGDPDLKAWPVFAISSSRSFFFWPLVRLLHLDRLLARPRSRRRRPICAPRCWSWPSVSWLHRCFPSAFPILSSVSFTGGGRVARLCQLLFLGVVTGLVFWFALRLTFSPAAHRFFRRLLAELSYPIAALAGIYGLVNARIIRIRRIPVQMPNLPASWRGRRAVMMSDLHLGPINGVRFCRRRCRGGPGLKPDAVFIPGDLFDGTKGDLDRLVAPLKQLTPPLGIYFSTGNHEEFTSTQASILRPSRGRASAFLPTSKLMVDGLQIAGVIYHDSSSPLRMKAALDAHALSTVPTRPAHSA